MGADIKTLRNRIKSVDSTLHLTKAMGLVASSKIRKAIEGMNNGKKYEEAVKNSIRPILNSPECRKSPYLRTGGEKLCLVVIAGDRGLAGGYNANIFRAIKDYPDAHLVCVGKRVCDRFGKEYLSAEYFTYQDAVEIAERLCEDFKEGKFDKIAILCSKYISMLTQEVQLKEIFPIAMPEEEVKTGVIFEPDEMTVLNTIVPTYVAGMIISAVRESFACEVAARRCAMDSAGKNAQQMIEDLQLQYNRARQGAITQEITEIVAGSDS